MAVDFNNQNYIQLYRLLSQKRQKFEDPTFPAEASSLNRSSSATDVEWLRPTELTPNPHLVVDGVKGSDMMQGERGNAWFVTASAAITTRPALFNAVLPRLRNQDYGNGSFHPGIFEFHFYRLGRLYAVVVDDRLPTKRGRLLHCQSGEQAEFWSALLEKAYAKLHGDYNSLKQGRCVDALSAFVRGLPEHWELSEVRSQTDIENEATQKQIWQLFKTYLGRRAVLVCSLQPNNNSRLGDWTQHSLVIGRGYIMCNAKSVELKDGSCVLLLQMQNSWNDLEWSGAWCDGSPEWKTVKFESRQQLNYEFKDDGLFWMQIKDVLNNFTDIDICIPNSSSSGRGAWVSKSFSDQWTVNVKPPVRQERNAGGCYDYPATYANNPQYLLQLQHNAIQTVSLCLEQGSVDSACNPHSLAEIGLDVFRVEVNRQCRLKEPPEESWFFGRVEPQRKPNIFLGANYRPGTYVVVPCTQTPDFEQSFTLTAFSQEEFCMSELTQNVPNQGSCCSCCYWSRSAVTRIRVVKVVGVCKALRKQNVKIMARISCESSDIDKSESHYCSSDKNDSNTHSLELSLLLYRHNLESSIDIDIYYRNKSSPLKHYFGKARITDKGCSSCTVKQAQLHCDGEPLDAFVHCEVQISGDLTYF